MNNKTYRKIEKYLYHQMAIEKALKDARAEMLANHGHDNTGGGRSNIPGNPTEAQAIKLLTPIKSVDVDGLGVVVNPAAWLYCFDTVYAMQHTNTQKLLRRRYYTHSAGVERLALDYGKSGRQVYTICREFINDISRCLAQMGVLKFY